MSVPPGKSHDGYFVAADDGLELRASDGLAVCRSVFSVRGLTLGLSAGSVLLPWESFVPCPPSPVSISAALWRAERNRAIGTSAREEHPEGGWRIAAVTGSFGVQVVVWGEDATALAGASRRERARGIGWLYGRRPAELPEPRRGARRVTLVKTFLGFRPLRPVIDVSSVANELGRLLRDDMRVRAAARHAEVRPLLAASLNDARFQPMETERLVRSALDSLP